MLIKKEKDEILNYLEDASNLGGGGAECVFVPGSEEEVVETVCECSARQMPLTISAGGTGVVGGRVPFGGAVLSTEKLNNILEINGDDRFAVLQSGVIIDDFLKELSRKGLFYPPFPTERTAFIGGNVATNASGEYSFKFGCTRRYVRRIRTVLSDGKVLDIRRGETCARDGVLSIPSTDIEFKIPGYTMPGVSKNSAGYYSNSRMDLIDLFIGSEGTLGIVTEVEVDVIEQLPDVFFCAVFFRKDEDAFSMAGELKERKDVLEDIFCVEYCDSNSLFHLREFYSLVPPAARGCILLGAQMKSPEGLDVWDELLSKYDPIDTWFGDTEKHKEDLYGFRHKLPEIVNDVVRKNRCPKISTDIVVPEDNFREMNDLYRESLGGAGLKYVVFGHIGECHLHVNLLPENETQLQEAKKIALEFAKQAVKLGGTVSGEHGIGKVKQQFLKVMYGEAGMSEMVRVKKAVDRNYILGLGNIFAEAGSK